MPVPRSCPRPSCPYHRNPPPRWLLRYGFYPTTAHGIVQRYRCRHCGVTFSDQTESLHYFAKRHLPLTALWHSLLEGASLRELARRYHVSPPTVQNAVLRLGRQAMAAQIALLAALRPCQTIVYDGLRSCVSSQDYPCDITTAVEAGGETILTMTHTVMRRGGTMTDRQLERVRLKESVWHPQAGTMSRDIDLLHREIWDYLRPLPGVVARICTDEQPLYARRMGNDQVTQHFKRCRQFAHLTTPSTAERTITNRLFPVNYVDRLLRHRLREHTRESIAIGRQATMQMHRAWIFAWDHNCLREYRVKRPHYGTHAAQRAVQQPVVNQLTRGFFTRRRRVEAEAIPESIERVWRARLPGPPLRWKIGQKGTSVRVPAYALRDLLGEYQQAQ